jgi:Domain of unknown function (DUF4440)
MKSVRAIALTVAALLSATVPVLAAPAAPAADTPADVAARFLQAFEKKDFQTIRGLFAPGATVSTAELSRSEAPKMVHRTAEEWLAFTEKQMAPVKFSGFKIFETSTLAFDQGASVSVHFRSQGTFGDFGFVNEGVDTYSLTQVDGAWRILRYGTFERLDAAPTPK